MTTQNDTPGPVAWANADDDGIYEVGLSEAHAHYVLERAANGNYSHRNPRIVPLYREPTLTDAEREVIACAAESYSDNDDDEDCARVARTLRGLLERTGGRND
jgi:sirohydrochlorin ferrochelatase